VLPADLTPAQVAQRLEPYRPKTVAAGRRTRRAAVAAILRFDGAGPGAGPEVLLIERAVNAADRWSGHVSFPGGHWEERDPDLLATSIRETREEVGVDLGRAGRLLGLLPPLKAVARQRILPMTITPFVFHLAEAHPVVLGAEAAGWFWLPLAAAASGVLDGRHEYRLGPVPLQFPCWRHDGHVVWGLTLQMLRSLLATVAR
jgi:8-oxo-dGTP pyrophosphatase MutT (NUDIX family)